MSSGRGFRLGGSSTSSSRIPNANRTPGASPRSSPVGSRVGVARMTPGKGGHMASSRIVQLTKENDSLRAELEKYQDSSLEDFESVIAERDDEICQLKNEMDTMRDEIDHLDRVHGKLEDKWRRSTAQSVDPQVSSEAFRGLSDMSDIVLRTLHGEDICDDRLPSRPEFSPMAEDVFVQMTHLYHQARAFAVAFDERCQKIVYLETELQKVAAEGNSDDIVDSLQRELVETQSKYNNEVEKRKLAEADVEKADLSLAEVFAKYEESKGQLDNVSSELEKAREKIREYESEERASSRGISPRNLLSRTVSSTSTPIRLQKAEVAPVVSVAPKIEATTSSPWPYSSSAPQIDRIMSLSRHQSNESQEPNTPQRLERTTSIHGPNSNSPEVMRRCRSNQNIDSVDEEGVLFGSLQLSSRGSHMKQNTPDFGQQITPMSKHPSPAISANAASSSNLFGPMDSGDGFFSASNASSLLQEHTKPPRAACSSSPPGPEFAKLSCDFPIYEDEQQRPKQSPILESSDSPIPLRERNTDRARFAKREKRVNNKVGMSINNSEDLTQVLSTLGRLGREIRQVFPGSHNDPNDTSSLHRTISNHDLSSKIEEVLSPRQDTEIRQSDTFAYSPSPPAGEISHISAFSAIPALPEEEEARLAYSTGDTQRRTPTPDMDQQSTPSPTSQRKILQGISQQVSSSPRRPQKVVDQGVEMNKENRDRDNLSMSCLF